MILFSVIIATFNSSKTLPQVLKAVREQTISQDQIEILLIDGFSKDNTREIGSQFKAMTIDNPYVDPVNAKYIGYQKAAGKFLVYLDHDEVLDNPDSFKNKLHIFESNPKIAAIATSGYRNPEGFPFLNQYINDFGDPFSAYFYNLTKDHGHFIGKMKSRYEVSSEDQNAVAFHFRNLGTLPLIELCAAGATIRKDFFNGFEWGTLDIPHLFYLMTEKGGEFAIAKNDSLTHYSSESFEKYTKKIKWRIKNNIFFKETLGQSGFTGRVKLEVSFFRKIKPVLFIPYAALIVPSFIHSLLLVVERKNPKYFFHAIVAAYTAFWIVTYQTLKLLGYKPKLKSYDEKTTIRSSASN